MKYIIQPYEGAGTIRLGAHRSEILHSEGVPESTRIMKSGEIEDRWSDRAIRYSKGMETVVEIEFDDDASLDFNGVDLFSDPNAFKKLLESDGNALSSVGTVVLLNLGLSLWNMESMESPRTVCLFCRGRWDHKLPSLIPYRLEE